MSKVSKDEAIQNFIEFSKNTLAQGLDREKLATIKAALVKLANQKEWWQADVYPAPTGEALQQRYLISTEADDTFTLYLNVMKPGKKIVPHDHTTWACIAGVEGAETNYLYDRLDDASKPGYAQLEQTDKLKIAAGDGIALMPDDIHAVRIEDDEIRHLHFYGLALERLDQRKAFDLDNNSYKIMDIGVKSVKA